MRTLSGTGSPEGVVAAPVGSTYIDTAATNGALVWRKRSGAGPTGWRVENADTGARDISTIIPFVDTFRFQVQTGSVNYGRAHLRRIGDRVEWLLGLEYASPTASSSPHVIDIPAGFRPFNSYSRVLGVGYTGGNDVIFAACRSNTANRLTLTKQGASSWQQGDQGYVTFSYITPDPWPTTLPGNPA